MSISSAFLKKHVFWKLKRTVSQEHSEHISICWLRRRKHILNLTLCILMGSSTWGGSLIQLMRQVIIIPPPPQTLFVVGILFSRCPSVRTPVHPSVSFFFLNILKSHCWIFIKLCKHVHICKTNILNKKLGLWTNSFRVTILCSSK